MVNLNDISTANRALVTSRDLVAVAAGGTSGIGETTLRELAIASGAESNAKGLRVYIIARRPAAAKDLIADLTKSCPKGEFIAVEASDLALLKDVDKVCEEIVSLERQRAGEKAKIDLVLLSQGYFDPFGARSETAEGLEFRVSLHFYSRMRIIYQLLPLLIARPESAAPAQIISVYAGGMEKSGKMWTDDLSLRQPGHFGFSNARATVVNMKTMFFEHLSNDYPGKLSLVHVFPGFVITPVTTTLTKPPYPMWFRLTARIMLPISKFTIATPLPESGQRTLFLATSSFPSYASGEKTVTTATGLPVARSTTGVLGGGAYSCTVSGETNDVSKSFRDLRPAGFYDKVWDHVMDVFTTIEAGKKFTN